MAAKDNDGLVSIIPSFLKGKREANDENFGLLVERVFVKTFLLSLNSLKTKNQISYAFRKKPSFKNFLGLRVYPPQEVDDKLNFQVHV